jgi:hypothetical protein
MWLWWPLILIQQSCYWQSKLEFVSNLPLQGGLHANPSIPWNVIHSLPCRNPCRPFHPWSFLWTLRPSHSSLKWTWSVSTFFNQWERYEKAMVTCLHCHAWSGPKTPWLNLVEQPNEMQLLRVLPYISAPLIVLITWPKQSARIIRKKKNPQVTRGQNTHEPRVVTM